MRLTICLCIAALGIGTGAFVVRAAAESALGVIETADNAHVDGLEATAGSNFFAGEEFVTYDQGDVHLRVNDCQIDLGATTDARFLTDSTTNHLLVIQGTARYHCPAGASLVIEAPAGLIRAAQGQAVSGMVVVKDPKNLVIAAYGQGLILDNDGERHSIAAGQTYRVAVEENTADSEAWPTSQFQKTHRRRRLAFWLIGGGGISFAAYKFWDNETEAPYKQSARISRTSYVGFPTYRH
jgi:hypothetical protein